MAVLLIVLVVSSSYAQSEFMNVSRNLITPDLKEPFEKGLWSQLLEEWTISNK